MTRKYESILRLKRGSQTYGTSTPDSDEDYLEIVIPKIGQVLGLDRFKGQQVIEKGIDTTYVTLHDFIKGCLSGRNELIVNLFVRSQDVVEHNRIGLDLYLEREALLSRRIFLPLIGFAHGQLKKTLNGNKDRFRKDLGYDPKSAYHAVRVLYTGIRFKQLGRLEAWIGDETFTRFCLEIKQGMWSRRRVVGQIEHLIKKFDEAECHKGIPDAPDFDYWNEFVIDAYCRALNLERTYEEDDMGPGARGPKLVPVWDV